MHMPGIFDGAKNRAENENPQQSQNEEEII